METIVFVAPCFNVFLSVPDNCVVRWVEFKTTQLYFFMDKNDDVLLSCSEEFMVDKLDTNIIYGPAELVKTFIERHFCGIKSETSSNQKCNCSSRDLLWFGCRCKKKTDDGDKYYRQVIK